MIVFLNQPLIKVASKNTYSYCLNVLQTVSPDPQSYIRDISHTHHIPTWYPVSLGTWILTLSPSWSILSQLSTLESIQKKSDSLSILVSWLLRIPAYRCCWTFIEVLCGDNFWNTEFGPRYLWINSPSYNIVLFALLLYFCWKCYLKECKGM